MVDFNFHITTPRLYLSYSNPFSDAHIDFTTELVQGAALLRAHPEAKDLFSDREAVRQRLQDSIESIQKTGYGRYLVSLRPENDVEDSDEPFSERKLVPVGTVGLQMARLEGIKAPTIPDVGFSFLEQYHGKGYATEAVQALMKYYMEDKGVCVFAGFTDENNEGARKLFKRLGFENHGVKKVGGIMWNGNDIDADSWTWGLKEGQKVEDFGI